MLQRIIQVIPNGITLLNLLAGIFSIYFSLHGYLWWAAYAIFLASVFDFLDGFAARLFNAVSDIGKELDSLSDVVSFGVAPGFIAFMLIGSDNPWASVAFLLPLAAAYRLARFNVLQTGYSGFSGLPVPATGIFFASLAFQNIPVDIKKWFLLFNVVLLAYLMVSSLPLFSFKISSYSFRSAYRQYILLIVAASLMLIFGVAALWMSVYVYLILNLFSVKS